jgi:hypothetical protein
VLDHGICEGPAPACPTPVCYQGEWECESPIVIDAKGEGFHLTSAEDGVMFDFTGDGHMKELAITDPRFGNGWLVLDRNGNGTIDNASEMFGNQTPQPESDERNDFRALAVFDKPENSGNGDGSLSNQDAIYSKLRLWIHADYNEVSEAEELHPLAELGVAAGAQLCRPQHDGQERQPVPLPGTDLDRKGVRKDKWTYDVLLQHLRSVQPPRVVMLPGPGPPLRRFRGLDPAVAL